jgi:hypothetical protein
MASQHFKGIWDNWNIFLFVQCGLFVVAFLQRYFSGNDSIKQHMKGFVHQKLGGNEFGSTIRRRAWGSKADGGLKKPVAAAAAENRKAKKAVPARGKKARRSTLVELAVLEAEGEGLKHHDRWLPDQKDAAYCRLKVYGRHLCFWQNCFARVSSNLHHLLN